MKRKKKYSGVMAKVDRRRDDLAAADKRFERATVNLLKAVRSYERATRERARAARALHRAVTRREEERQARRAQKDLTRVDLDGIEANSKGGDQ